MYLWEGLVWKGVPVQYMVVKCWRIDDHYPSPTSSLPKEMQAVVQRKLIKKLPSSSPMCYYKYSEKWKQFPAESEMQQLGGLALQMLIIPLFYTFTQHWLSHITHLKSHRRSSKRRPSLVLKPHISWALWRGKQQNLPSAGGGWSRVESFIAGTGDDYYLVVLTQINTPRVQQSLKVSQKVLRCLSCYQSLWHCSVSKSSAFLDFDGAVGGQKLSWCCLPTPI